MFAVFVFIGTVQAADIEVNGGCSIIEAIQTANSDLLVNSCVVGSGADTITLTADITLTAAFQNNSLGSTGTPAITSEIIIDGQGFGIQRSGPICTKNGTNDASEFRLMRVGTSGNLTVKNITLSNGCADGSGIHNAGGAILNRTSLSVENTTFSGNAANRGAGIYSDDNIATIQNSTFSGNSATSGGGVYNEGSTGIIENSTFSGNLATVNGHGIFNKDGSIISLRNSLFHLNLGGGIECFHEGTGAISGHTNLSNNASSGCPDVNTSLTTSKVGPLADNGGSTWTHALLPGSEAIDASGVSPTLTDQRGFAANGIRDIGAFEAQPIELCPTALQSDGFTTSVANPAELNEAIECANLNGDANGGDTINLSSDITLTTDYVSDASTGTATITSPITLDGMGFGILRDDSLNCNLNGINTLAEFRIIRIGASGDLTLGNITLSKGCADGSGNARNGGAIFNEGVLSIENSTFSDNSAYYIGGGIYNITGTITSIQNSTFSNNTATNEGGGIYNRATISIIQNSTFSGNSAVNGFAIRNINVTIGALRNSLFHENTGTGFECDHSGTGSIIGVNNLSDQTNSQCPGVSTLTTDKVSSVLADNGGPTWTHALFPGSEAIDAGNVDSTDTDQRGFAKNGTRDIGAFEAQPVELCPLALQTDGFTTSVANPTDLIEAIECANLNGDANGGDTINLSADITLTASFEEDITHGSTGTPAITTPITLDGMGFDIVRDGACTIDETNDVGDFRLIRIEIMTGDLSLNNITLSNGCADGTGNANLGGAILNEGVLSIDNTTISGNSAKNGGGIRNRGSINTIGNSTFSGNSAKNGAGIRNSGAITIIQNSTFSANSAENSGGAILNNNIITTIKNSTFSGNHAGVEGGGIENSGTIDSLQYSLMYQNTGLGNECSGPAINGYNNLSDDISSVCPHIASLTPNTLGPLANNGGSTKTHALLPKSEAIDAGDMNSTPTDQRGFVANGTRDIGAFEAQPSEYCQDEPLQTDGFTTSVANSAELNQAIVCANLNGDSNGGDTINLSSDITLDAAFETNSFGSTGTPAIDSPITLNGMNFNIESDGTCIIDGTNDSTEYRLIRVGATGDFILNNITLSNGCADGAGIDSNGGGVYNSGVLSVDNSSFIDNFAGFGAGIRNDGTINTIRNSTLSGNSALNAGGGIENFNTITTIQNSTFSGNSANIGGGISNFSSTLTTLENSTFSGNLATINGAAIANSFGTISMLRNSLFHQNIDGGGVECFEDNGTFNGSNNISDNLTSGCPNASTTLTTDTVDSVLTDNSGPTMTHALLPGSEAINLGDDDSTATDQRRFGANGKRDIGAYEFNGNPWFFQDGFEDQL